VNAKKMDEQVTPLRAEKMTNRSIIADVLILFTSPDMAKTIISSIPSKTHMAYFEP
jgi:hypothetical protein